ncbi:unnamed protein product [Protopolystoma xenopodis]|uniref:Uncharacterized protein n=1 Tax=Protopolystoma xenopodis TaxID=117903 RepID=A0A3S5APQ8_9PLAT|nr:unnamed protein product [Protopolystoma xenopodis]
MQIVIKPVGQLGSPQMEWYRHTVRLDRVREARKHDSRSPSFVNWQLDVCDFYISCFFPLHVGTRIEVTKVAYKSIRPVCLCLSEFQPN